jgi:hypothetical protein
MIFLSESDRLRAHFCVLMSTQKPGFPLQSFLRLCRKKGFPLQSLARKKGFV